MLPNFIMIGAPRSGTTTLHFALEQHPEVFVSGNKEPNSLLFDDAGAPLPGVHNDLIIKMQHRSVRTRPEYEALFAGVRPGHQARGEASPAYMYFPAVAERIESLLPAARLLVILRQPVDQALSLFSVRQQGETPSGKQLADAFVHRLETETADTSGYGIGLAEYGRYDSHLETFFDRFGCERIHVMLTEDLEATPGRVLADLFRFLGVDPTFEANLSRRMNESGTAKSAWLHRAVSGNQALKSAVRATLPEAVVRPLRHVQHRIRSANLQRTHMIPPNLRRDLTRRYYGEEIERLQDRLGRDLRGWLN